MEGRNGNTSPGGGNMGAMLFEIGAYRVTVLAAAVASTAVLLLLLGLYALVSEEALQESIYFFFFCLAVTVWLGGFAASYAAPDRETALRWIRGAYLGVPLIPPALYTATVHILGVSRRRRYAMGTLWVLGAAFALLIVGSSLVIEGVRQYPWGFFTDYSPAGGIFVAYTAVGIGASLWEYARRYREADRERSRDRAVHYLTAFTIGSAAMIDFLPSYGIAVQPVGFLAILVMAGLIAWTMRTYPLSELTPAFAAERILATMSDPVLVVDNQGRIEVANEGVRSVLGYQPGELEGRSLEALFGESPDGAALVSTLQRADTVREEEFTVRTATGTEVPASISTSGLTDRDDRRVGTVIVARDVQDRKALEEQLRHQAFHDRLTGLPNRALLEDRLEQLVRLQRRHPDRQVGVLYLDIDRFKSVNDRFGHSSGDQVLEEVADRLDASLREEDTAGRLGGDEFVVLVTELPPDSAEEELLRVSRRILEEVERPVELEGGAAHVSVSMGANLATGENVSSSALLRRADLAMYNAKVDPDRSVVLFRPEFQEDADRRARIDRDLDGALDRGEIDVHYQPILDLVTETYRGFEALLRWQHPDLGMISPAEFVPVAERTGRISELEAWVLEEACLQLRRWRDQHEFSPEPIVSVNLSDEHLQSEHLLEHVRSALDGADLSPSSLTVEVTERVVAGNRGMVARNLERLQQLGVGISIDDFGTGTSSLARLRDLPVDGVKIDRQFVHRLAEDRDGQAFVVSILQLTEQLGLDVIAEGVEEPADWERLRELEVPQGQGFLWERPLPAEELSRRLGNRKHNA